MQRPWWQACLDRLRDDLNARTPRRKTAKREFARLSLRKLEDRRVLDGAAVAAPPPVEITEDAGAVVIAVGPADGAPDVFEVIREEADGKDLLQVTVNGSLVFSKDLDLVASVSIKGSGDQETLVVDFGNGDPIPVGGINFAGAGEGAAATGADTILFVNGAVDSAAYSLSGSNEGQVSLTVGGTTSTVEFSGNVQTINDSLSAMARSFTVGGTIADVGLSASGVAGSSQLTAGSGLQVTFTDPQSALQIQDATATGLAITVNGLDSQFQADLTIAGGDQSVVQFTGPTAVGAGDIHVTGGRVTVDSSLSSLGGTIEISAYDHVIVSQNGSVTTPGGSIAVTAPTIEVEGTIAAVNGGHIRLDAGLDGTLLVTGHVDASSTAAGLTGGTIDLLGARVGLTGAAVVDVSGTTGGGSVRIGGDWHGSNAEVQSSLRTYIGDDVTIRADALVSGNGGSVVVWSDEVTAFYGQIVARGGSEGGAGGSVEVSSEQLLLYRGNTDLTAASGATGTLLLDPLTITIVDQSGGADDIQLNANVPNPGDPAGAIFYGDVAAGNFTISETALEASTANIVLQARNTITVGNLTTDGVILLQPNVNLTFQTRNNGAAPETFTGGIVFANTTNTIQAQGTGTITLNAGTALGSTADAMLGNLVTASGAITVTAARNLTVAGNISSGGGAVSLTADVFVVGTGTFTVNAGQSVSTSGGSLTIASADINLVGTLNSGAGTTTLQATNVRTVGIGDVVNIGAPGSQYGLSGAELQNITAGNLIIGAISNTFVNGNITVDGVTAANVANVTGTITLRAPTPNRSVTFSGGASTFKALSVVASDGVSVNTNLTTTGALTVNADSNSNGVGTFTVAALQTVDSTSHAISVTAADIALSGFLNSGSATTTLQATANRTIGIGDIANIGPAGSQFALSGAELQNITAGNLTIGGATTGNITVDAVTALQVAGVAGTVTLQTPAAGRTITFSGGVSTFKTLTALASDGVSANTSLTTTGPLTVNADTNSNGIGTFTIAAAQTVDSTSHAISVTAADVALSGFLNSGSAITTLQATANRTIGIGDVANIGPAGSQFALSGAELQNITAGDLTIGGLTSGNITVDAIAALQVAGIAGTVTLRAPSAGRTITFSGGASTFKTLTALAADGVSVNTDLTTTGVLTIDADTNTDNVGDFTTAIGTAVDTTGNLLSITAADVVLAGTLNSGTAVTEIRTSTLGREIDLGTNTAGKLSLTDAELDLIAAATLRVGRNDALASGQITVSAGITPAGTTRLHLLTGAGVGTSGAGAIVENELAISAVGPVSLLNANDVDKLAADLTGATQGFAFNDTDSLAIDSVDGVSGVTTNDGNILLHAGATLALNAAVNAGTGDARFVANGDITQAAAGIITADELGVRQESAVSGDITLTEANDVNTLAASNAFAGGVISFVDSDDLTIGSVAADTLFTATSGLTTNDGDILLHAGATLALNAAVNAGTGDARLVANGDITQTAAGTITADELGVRQESAASGDITLTQANDVNTLAASNAFAGGEISFLDTDDLTIGSVSGNPLFTATSGVTTNDGDILFHAGATLALNAAVNAGTGDARFVANGDITQTAAGTITADELGVRQESAASGNITLTETNDINTFAASNAFAGGQISFLDTDDLTIGAVSGTPLFTATSGVTTNDGDILLHAGSTLAINAAVNAGTGDARFVANGDITQTAAGTITADELGVRQESAASGDITLTEANDVNTFAASNALAGGQISFLDTDDLTIGSVSGNPLFTATSGVTTNDGDVLLHAGSTLAINAAVNAGTGDARLVANGDITQTAAGTITADELGVRQESAASGDITLTEANDINTFAASNAFAGGQISFLDTDDLTIGAVSGTPLFTATSGVTTNDGDILLHAGATLAINAAVNAGTGDARFVANGDITQTAAGTITADELGVRQESAASGSITLTEANDVNTLAASNAFAGGEISFVDSDDLTIGTVAADTLFTATSGVTTNDGDILLHAGATLALNAAVNAGTGDARLVANGDITQTAAGTITADELGVRQESAASGDITLTQANDVNTLAASNAFAGGEISFVDSDDLTIGSVSGNPLFTATSGVTTNDGDILLHAGATLALNAAVNAGTGDARFVANGDVTQTAAGTITADELGVRQESAASGDITLTEANDVNTFAASNAFAGGEISFLDTDDLTIGAVSGTPLFTATSGVTTNDGDILLHAGSTLAINAAVNAGTGDARFVANGDITQTAAGTITADELGVRQESAASGSITLTEANDVNTLAASNAFAGGEISFVDSDDLTIGSVSGNPLFTATSGVTTNDGDILLHAGATLALNAAVNAGTGDARFVANGDVTQTAAGTITADELGVRQESAASGDITLTEANDVNTFAASNAFAGGQISFLDTDDLTIGAVSGTPLFTATSGVTTNNGQITVTAGDLTINQAVSAGTGHALLTTDGIAINAAVTGSLVTVQNLTIGREIDLGTNTAGKLSLTDGELDLITADRIHIGRNDALASGQITLSAVISPAGTSLVHLFTGAGLGTTGAGAIIENQLAISAVGPVSLVNSNDVDQLAANLTGASQPFAFKDSDDLEIAIVDGVVGLVTNGGDATLNLGGAGTQQAGADIIAAGLELIGGTGFNFTNPNNDVVTLAANTVGPVSYRDVNDLAIGTVNSTVGITTVGADVTVEAGGNLSLDQAIMAPGATVDLKSDSAAIIDGNGAATNITANSLALQAATGIGSSDQLETAVSTLSAYNSTSGNVQIFNDVAGPLTIGVVNGVTGVQNSGGGLIEITNNGAMTVNAMVSNDGGGDITLTALNNGGNDDHLTLNAVVQAVGGSGDIYLNGGTDLVINDSGSGVDVMTQNDGEIFGLAQRIVIIGTNVIIQTGTGAISTIYPALDGVNVPQLTAWGVATLTGFFGDPGAHNFTITVDWADGTVETFYFDDPGTFTFTHTYTSNPNKSDQSAPIPVTVTVYDDPNSHFVGMQQFPVTITINTTDSKTIANELDIVTTFTNTPGEGLGIFRIDTSLHIIPPLFPALPVLTYLFDSPGLSSLDAGGFERDGATFEESVIEARQVLLVTVNPQGIESEPVVLDESVLDDLPGLFRRLPDGHYKIYLREIGEQRVRLLIDVNLRGGKPADASEGGQDKPPTVEIEANTTGALRQDAAEADTTAVAGTVGEIVAEGIDRLATGGEAVHMPEPSNTAAIAVQSEVELSVGGDVSVSCGAAAIGMIPIGRSWAERVDSTLGDPRNCRLSKGARLARRVRRRLVSSGTARSAADGCRD